MKAWRLGLSRNLFPELSRSVFYMLPSNCQAQHERVHRARFLHFGEAAQLLLALTAHVIRQTATPSIRRLVCLDDAGLRSCSTGSWAWCSSGVTTRQAGTKVRQMPAYMHRLANSKNAAVLARGSCGMRAKVGGVISGAIGRAMQLHSAPWCL